MHNHCLQFRMKIRNTSQSSSADENESLSYNNNNELLSEPVIEDGMVFSELIDKLHTLTIDRGITYTVTECLLDQVSFVDSAKVNCSNLCSIFRPLNVYLTLTTMQYIHTIILRMSNQKRRPELNK